MFRDKEQQCIDLTGMTQSAPGVSVANSHTTSIDDKFEVEFRKVILNFRFKEDDNLGIRYDPCDDTNVIMTVFGNIYCAKHDCDYRTKSNSFNHGAGVCNCNELYAKLFSEIRNREQNHIFYVHGCKDAKR